MISTAASVGPDRFGRWWPGSSVASIALLGLLAHSHSHSRVRLSGTMHMPFLDHSRWGPLRKIFLYFPTPTQPDGTGHGAKEQWDGSDGTQAAKISRPHYRVAHEYTFRTAAEWDRCDFGRMAFPGRAIGAPPARIRNRFVWESGW